MIGLLNRLRKFLAGARKPTVRGGWAEVSPADVADLTKIITLILSAKWSRDSDGDLPIEISVVDRTHFEGLRFRPVPYTYDQQKPSTIKKIEAALDIAAQNLSGAHGRFAALWATRRAIEYRAKK